MSKIENRIGLTPIRKRIAYHYMCLGRGDYQPNTVTQYDRVLVRDLYEFMENPVKEGEHAGGLVVEFYNKGRRIRWVEFRCQVTGGGGDEVFKKIEGGVSSVGRQIGTPTKPKPE